MLKKKEKKSGRGKGIGQTADLLDSRTTTGKYYIATCVLSKKKFKSLFQLKEFFFLFR